MKALTKSLFGAIALSGMLWSCTADKVAPKDEAGSPTLGKYAEGEHPAMDPTCSDTAWCQLVSIDGSSKVNYPALTATSPNWGSMYVVNSDDTIGCFISLASGWFIDFSKSYLGLGQNLAIDQVTGRPNTTQGDWSSIDVNPLVNRWQYYVHRDAITKDAGNCFSMALNLTVVKLSFFGGIQAGSSRTLWASNASWNQTSSQWSSTSQYVLPWCWSNCPVVWPAPVDVCASAYAGLPGNNGCTTLTPDVTGANGALTYAWSDNSTGSSLNVCPNANTTYSVSITDSEGPFAVYNFNVNVYDAGCQAGNSPQHKVKVCHLPPGNPANVQNICIDWSGVPAHVARFRPLGSNGLPSNQGHDSGCEIGECGSNPCN